MTKTFAVLAVVAAVFMSVVVSGSRAADAPPRLENLARGKPYTMEPAPNYKYCTDAGDKTQLTDGVYTRGHFWTQNGTVGWSGAHHVIVTIDLGTVQPICGASYNTAAGVAGVTWPAFIPILVSDDGKAFYCVGDLVELDTRHGIPPASGYGVRRYWTDQLAAHGRYVKLVVAPSGPYIFTDEIEVCRGTDGLLKQPLAGQKIVDTKDYIKQVEVTIRVRQRLRNDLAAVRAELKGIGEEAECEKAIAAIEKEIAKLQVAASDDFRAILPLNDLHKRIFAVQAAVWRARGAKPITVWQKNAWDMLSPTEPPLACGAKIDVSMMQNEWRSAAFNLSNAGSTPVDLALSITWRSATFNLSDAGKTVTGVPGDTNPKWIAVCAVPFTDTKSGVPVAAALPPAKSDGQHYLLHIEPGMTQQVWLTFHSKDLSPGKREGQILIEPGDIAVPLRLNVYPFTFPAQPTLHLGGWDYTDADKMYEVTPQNRAALIQHLREHFVDSPWATGGVMPYGKYDKDGNMIAPPEVANFEKWVKRWPDARRYLVFSSVGSQFAGLDMGTPPFQKAVANWITWWAEKLPQWHIRPEQLGLLLVDEPNQLEQDKVIVEYAKVIRQAQPKVIVWEDPTWEKPWNSNPDVFRYSTVLSPNLPMWIEEGKRFADFYVKQRQSGRELWYYSCSGPGKLLDPYTYHRMQQWFCWKYDAKGSGFWAFGDSNGASSWNEYAAQIGAYTPVFLDSQTVTAGKHMEAIREGIEDYEYLRMLRDRLAELEKKGARNQAVAAAQRLLDSAADRVTACMKPGAAMFWRAAKDRSVADQVRVEVLEALVRLKDL
jgi:hypothetical protein